MADTVVVYTSQTGFTQQYALWIAKQLHCELLDLKFVTNADLLHRRVVIYGGHLLVNHIQGFRQFYRRFRRALPPHLLVFGAGLTPASQIDCATVRKHDFKTCQSQPQFFYFRGKVVSTSRLRQIWLRRQSQRSSMTLMCGRDAVDPLLEAAHQVSHDPVW